MTESWMRETMRDLRTDSPYYWEMKETEQQHRREMEYLRRQELNDMRYEIEDDKDDDEEDED